MNQILNALSASAGMAGIYNVATIPEVRRRGIGSTMTLEPLRMARAFSYHLGILQSSEMGFGVYHQLDFQEYFKVGLYIWPGKQE